MMNAPPRPARKVQTEPRLAVSDESAGNLTLGEMERVGPESREGCRHTKHIRKKKKMEGDISESWKRRKIREVYTRSKEAKFIINSNLTLGEMEREIRESREIGRGCTHSFIRKQQKKLYVPHLAYFYSCNI